MKTRCPNCQTAFRVTPQQLKARVGKVRCGQCQAVFNALDSLLEDKNPMPFLLPPDEAALSSLPTHDDAPSPVAMTTQPQALDFDLETIDIHYPDAPAEATLPPPIAPAADANASFDLPDAPAFDDDFEPDPEQATAPIVPAAPLSESAARELGRATGLILPRETTKIPGYSKWSDGVMVAPLALPAERAARWPFVLVALALVLLLTGQLLFRFRSEIAVATPATRPALAAFVGLFGADIPLPRHVELVSIEASDLQKDAARGNLLVLNATLRNRASYAQAYPALELSLTDTQDAAIARRVFAPDEYLSSKLPATKSFAANSDLAVHLWIEAKDISAAGYRLYVFYP